MKMTKWWATKNLKIKLKFQSTLIIHYVVALISSNATTKSSPQMYGYSPLRVQAVRIRNWAELHSHALEISPNVTCRHRLQNKSRCLASAYHYHQPIPHNFRKNGRNHDLNLPHFFSLKSSFAIAPDKSRCEAIVLFYMRLWLTPCMSLYSLVFCHILPHSRIFACRLWPLPSRTRSQYLCST